MNDLDGGMDLNVVVVVVVDIWCVEVSNVVEMKVVPVAVGLMVKNSILETYMGQEERKLILAL